ncbi:MAG: hypothetical protein ACW98F_06255 [Candidatus Hodarchaeales archaeon]|jgi:hypothetical protein
MASRFDSKSYVLSQFNALAGKYFPLDYMRVNSGKKGFRLSDGTNNLIEKSKDIVHRTEEGRGPIPQSTANIYRYGIVFQKIFEDLSQYQAFTSVKSRSRRGYRKELEFLGFDLKKIELELKKSSNPSVKIQKDEKFVRDFKKLYYQMVLDEDFQNLKLDIAEKSSLFILEDSVGYKFYDTQSRLITSVTQKLDKLKSLKEEKRDLLRSQKAVEKKIIEITPMIPKNEKIIQSQKKAMGVYERTDKKEALLTDSEISLFLKILTTSLERYIKMIERREKQRLEQRDQFLKLILEPTKYKGLDEVLWKQIVFIIESHGIELLQGKNWFHFRFPDELRSYITNKDVLSKFADLRTLEKELEEIDSKLQKNSAFYKATNLIEELENAKNSLAESKEKIPKLGLEIQQSIEAIKEEKQTILRTLD